MLFANPVRFPDIVSQTDQQRRSWSSRSVPRFLYPRLTRAEFSVRSDNKEPEMKTGRNALQHGAFSIAEILPGEDKAKFVVIRGKLYEDMRPHGATEFLYFGNVVNCAWRQQRWARWRRLNDDGASFDVLAEVDIPARLSGEYDKAVRRFYQFRVSRQLLDRRDDEGYPRPARREAEDAQPVLPAPAKKLSSSKAEKISVMATGFDDDDDPAGIIPTEKSEPPKTD
jgi:hypothetical protein